MVALLFALALAGPALAQEPATAAATAVGLDPTPIIGEPEGAPLSGRALDDATDESARKLRCPTCQGMSVAESPAEGARAMKGEVRKLREKGYSDQQVLDFFEASYGEFILLEPHKKGANLALWLTPAAVAAVGGLFVLFGVRRKAPPAPPAGPAAGGDPYLDRVRREIES